mgnify:CR=1 FL=1
MNKSLLVGLVAGAGAATAVGAVANYARVSRAPDAVLTPAPAAASGTVQRDALAGRVIVPETAPVAAPGTEPPTAPAAPIERTATATASPRFEAAPVPRPARATYARVVDVRAVTDTVSEPREVCRDEPVVQPAPVRDEHRVAGTLLGAAIGGVLGNQVGGGDGRKIATVVGAVGGGYAGNRVQDRIQKSNTVTTTERRCETVYDRREVTRGYDVTYSYAGRTETVRMDHAPGERLPVRDGRVLTASR